MTTINTVSQPGLGALSQQPSRRSEAQESEERASEAPALPQDRVETRETQGRSAEEVFADLGQTRTAPANPDAARLLALDVRQQLQGFEGGIASVRPGSVLALLRNG